MAWVRWKRNISLKLRNRVKVVRKQADKEDNLKAINGELASRGLHAGMIENKSLRKRSIFLKTKARMTQLRWQADKTDGKRTPIHTDDGCHSNHTAIIYASARQHLTFAKGAMTSRRASRVCFLEHSPPQVLQMSLPGHRTIINRLIFQGYCMHKVWNLRAMDGQTTAHFALFNDTK